LWIAPHAHGAEPPTGHPDGSSAVPQAARAVDTSSPDVVIGDGTPASCTSAAVVAAVAEGGIITFDCGPDPVTIEMHATAKVVNNTGPEIVIDGGGLVTLSGRGERRILYMNTCDPAQVWTTPHCQNQDHPRLTVQNLTFVDGDGSGMHPDGGGAIFVRGGRFKIVNSRFFRNVCDSTGPDVAGGAVRVFSQFDGRPVYVTNSTFGGAPGYGNHCSNGGALGSIGVSWTVINSLFTHNSATGHGANPQRPGTPGGGNGGAIALDGNTMTLTLDGTRIEYNQANEGGGAVFFVSNNRTGHLEIHNSLLLANPSDGFETSGYPGVFVLAAAPPGVVNSVLSDTPAEPVERLAGPNRYATAAAISAWAYPEGSDVAFIATGVDFPDAIAGGAAAAAEGGPLLLVSPTSVPSETRSELNRLDPDRIVVLGGTNAVTEAVASALGAYGPVERRAGPDRYATAVEVSKGTFSSATTAVITTGNAFPDAMVGAGAAIDAEGPLLLVPPDRLPDSVLAELQRLGVSDVVIVGGPAAVSGRIAAELAATGRTVTRLAGSNRYSSAAAVSSHVFHTADTVLVSVGTNFPDALAGAAVSGLAGGPLLLVEANTIPGAAASELARLAPDEVIVLGGPAAVSHWVGIQLAAYQ
jgi:putative cell wall-binding protein